MKDYGQNIDRFINYFSKSFQEIAAANFPVHNVLMKKMLYVSTIDTLSKTTSTSLQRNRERFITFVINFCQWNDGDKISLPHLARLLQKTNNPEFVDLRRYAYAEFDKWQPGTVLGLDMDLEIAEVRKRWPNKLPKAYEGIQIEYLQHYNLMYRHRNSMVHEVRELGRGLEVLNATSPYYHHSKDVETAEEHWELVYPVEFYETLIKTGLKTLRTYFVDNRINPYDSFTYGSQWIEKLNL